MPYLDRRCRKRGRRNQEREKFYENIDRKNDRIEHYFAKVKMCGGQIFRANKVINLFCRRMMCPECGGRGKRIHRRWYGSIMRKVEPLRGKRMRQLVFTVPERLRGRFLSKEGLGRLFRIVKKVVERCFGEKVREKKTKKGVEPVYRMRKHVFAIVHLFGNEDSSFKPHINVLIFEDGGNQQLKLNEQELGQMRESYRKTLQKSLGKRVQGVVINYRYCLGERDMKRSVWYMTTPMNPDVPGYRLSEEVDFIALDLVAVELTKFRYVRQWGIRQKTRKKGRKKEGKTPISAREAAENTSKYRNGKTDTMHSSALMGHRR